MVDAVVKTIDVPCTPKTAFEIFTRDMGKWWPRDKHSVSAMSGETAKSVTMEPHVGGAVTEIGHDGTNHNWGSVKDFDPHSHLALLWHINKPADQATLVDVNFDAADSGTRVTLKHHGWEVLGEEAQGQRDGYNAGWVFVFETKFAQACETVNA